jgi:heme O synthase-like polyprenyltransferase
MQQSTRLTYVVAMKIAIVALLVYAVISTILAAKKRDRLLLAVTAAGILVVTGSALVMFLQPEH